MEVLSPLPKTKTRSKVSERKTVGSVRVGIIGHGYWGPNLVRNFHDLSTVELVAVCDAKEDRLRTLAKKFPHVKLTTNYQDLISNRSIDALIIATPISTHFDIASKALRAGKHLLVEKPLVATTQQGLALTRLAERSNRILMVGHTFEYHPAVLKVAELLKNQELGKLYYIDSVRVNLGLHQSDGLNVIWDLAPHDISIILHWVNKVPLRVSAWGQGFVQKGVEDVAFIRLEFPDEVLAHIHLSWIAPSKIRRMTVVGDKKMVIYDDVESAEKIKIADRSAQLDYSTRELRVGYRLGDIVSPRLETTEALALECSHFIDCILNKKTPRTDGERGIQVVRILEAAEKSVKKGGSIVTL